MTNTSDQATPDPTEEKDVDAVAGAGPMMDGALDDMSDAGTSKLESADLVEAGREREIEIDQKHSEK